MIGCLAKRENSFVSTPHFANLGSCARQLQNVVLRVDLNLTFTHSIYFDES